MNILSSVIPVFALIALGAIFQKTGFFKGDFLQGINRLVYWVGMPSFIFFKVSQAQATIGPALTILGALLITVGCIIVLAYGISWIWKIPKGSTGVFVQGAFRGNLTFVGLPIIFYSATDIGIGEPGVVETIAVLVLAPMIPIFNVISVTILIFDSKSGRGQKGFWNVVKEILTNPLLLSSLAGMAYAASGLPPIAVLIRTLGAVGQMALPLALIGVGASLVVAPLHGVKRYAVVSALCKVGLAPLIGWGIATMIGLPRMETAILLVYLSCPTAAASYVMAVKLGGNEGLASSSVVLSALLSIIPLSIIVALI